MNNPVGWFEIYVQDMPKAKKFYEAVFQKTLTKMEAPQFEMWAFPYEMEKAGAPGTLVKAEGMPSGNNSVVIYFSCEDCSVEQKRVAENGGKVLKEKFSIGEYGFISLVQDVDGNTIGLHSLK